MAKLCLVSLLQRNLVMIKIFIFWDKIVLIIIFIRVVATDMRYFARTKFFGSLVHRTNFGLIYDKKFSNWDTYVVKGGRIRHFSLNEHEEISQAGIILNKLVNKP